MTDLAQLLRCPRCGGPLQHGGKELRCTACGAEFTSDPRGIDFRRAFSTSRNSSGSLTRAALPITELTWPALLREYAERSKDRQATLYECASAGRAAFRVLLDFDRESTVLEIGGGTGLISSGIARFASLVVMIESRPEPASLARRRFEIHNPSNDIALLLVDSHETLPLRDALFDCVLLSSGSGWTGGDTDASAPGLSVPEQLREIRRVLKPGGQLFWTAENRFSYRRRWRFPSRAQAPLSYLGYRKVLGAQRFESSLFYNLVESRSHLGAILPLRNADRRWKPRRPPGWKSRVKSHPFVVPRYGIRADNGPGPRESVLSRVLDEIGRSISSSLTVRDFRLSRKDKAILDVEAAEGDFMLRMSLSPAGLASDERNARMLRFLSGNPRMNRLVPGFLARGEIGGQPFFAETKIPGRPLAKILDQVSFPAMAEEVRGMMDALNPSLGAETREALAGERFEREVSDYIVGLRALVSDEKALAALRDYFDRELRGLAVPFGITHGDFSLSNLFIDQETRLTGLIDWEGGSERSLPVLDGIHFVESHHRMLTGDRLGRAINRLARGDFAEETHRRFLYDMYERMGIAREAHRALVHLKWLRHMAYLGNFWLAFSAEGIRDFVTPVVSSILESPS